MKPSAERSSTRFSCANEPASWEVCFVSPLTLGGQKPQSNHTAHVVTKFRNLFGHWLFLFYAARGAHTPAEHLHAFKLSRRCNFPLSRQRGWRIATPLVHFQQFPIQRKSITPSYAYVAGSLVHTGHTVAGTETPGDWRQQRGESAPGSFVFILRNLQKTDGKTTASTAVPRDQSTSESTKIFRDCYGCKPRGKDTRNGCVLCQDNCFCVQGTI